MNKEHSGTLVATKSIPIYDSEKVLVFDSGNGTLGLAMSGRAPGSRFLLYESHVGSANLLQRTLQDSPNSRNVRVISEDELAQIRQIGNLLDVVVFQPQRFIALDLIRSQILFAKQVLRQGGRFYLVTHKKSGSSRHQGMLAEIFGSGVKIVGRGRGGYRVLEVVRNSIEQTQAERSLRRKVNFEIFGIEFGLESESSLFSKDELDGSLPFKSC